MSAFVLIVYLFGYYDRGGGPALSMHDFPTLSACETAGRATEQLVKAIPPDGYRGYAARYVTWTCTHSDHSSNG